jgi:hypothetical protein
MTRPPLIMISAMLALSLGGCALFQGRPVVTAQPNDCSSLIPESWKQGVEGVPLPGLDAVVGEVWAALDGQTGRLDQANGRTADTIGIIERCEERDRKAIERSTQGFFGRLFS